MRYEVKQDKFSGPLEKLLELIEAKELEITLINLAQVTGDFLEYLKALDEKSKHPSVLADFIVVASRLLLIKSKAILPSLALTEEEETDIKDLEMRLKIYKEFSAKGARSSRSGSEALQGRMTGEKNASAFLNDILQRKMCSHGRELFANLPVVFYPSQNITAKSLEENILDLISELKGLIPEKQTIRKVVVTIEQKMKELLERFREQAQSTFSTISKDKPKIEIIVLFLAILHLLRDKIIIASQENQFADIAISSGEKKQL